MGENIIIGLISGIVGAVITYFTTRSKIRLELTAEYDKELRKKRLEVYQELWKLLKPLARFSRENPITYQIVKDTSENMRNWYFDTGGIFLTKESRIPYFALKKEMQKIIDNDDLEKSVEMIREEELNPILRQGNSLRTSLSEDIGTRKKPWIQE
jgi:hypothetical protein